MSVHQPPADETSKFPECQLIPNGLSPQSAEIVGDAYRAKQPLPRTGNPKADEVIERLLSTSNYQQ